MTSETLDATLQRLAAGRSAWKDPCRVASSSNLTLSGEQTIDGVACVAGDRVLVAGQTSSVQNGIYVVATATWARAADMAKSAHVRHGMVTTVIDGSANAGIWELTSPTSGTITLGQTSLTISRVIADDTAGRLTALETPSQTVHTADGALVINEINICTSAADGMTLPDAATNAGKSVIVINDMAATDVTVTSAGSDTISGGSTSSTYVLPFGAGGVVTFIASAVSGKWYASPRLT